MNNQTFALSFLEGGKKLIICNFFFIIMSFLWSSSLSNLPSPVYFSLFFHVHRNLSFTMHTRRKKFNFICNFLVCIMFIMWLILRVLLGRWLPFCKSTRVKTRHLYITTCWTREIDIWHWCSLTIKLCGWGLFLESPSWKIFNYSDRSRPVAGHPLQDHLHSATLWVAKPGRPRRVSAANCTKTSVSCTKGFSFFL